MKLSEAMQKGCEMIRPQQGYFLLRSKDGSYRGCALGAAAVGEFGYPPESYETEWQIKLERAHPELHYREVLLDTQPQMTLRRAIMQKFDRMGQTTKQIIQWLKEQDL